MLSLKTALTLKKMGGNSGLRKVVKMVSRRAGVGVANALRGVHEVPRVKVRAGKGARAAIVRGLQHEGVSFDEAN
ncbi:hypothetical protein E2C01_070598 [Portunus trituberculatus]|uniref:Uncharacterized protein n=1 Tax=Portunus trituberculatus TaxID=210409 RepID=A0A5B7HT51_PORTR|nr:hypothetical protein [Portunus trituberculatus]